MTRPDRFPSVPVSDGQHSPTCRHFLSVLFGALDAHAIRYCVLHSWDDLPETVSSDLDIAIHPDDAQKVTAVIAALQEHGYTPVQVFNYLVGAYYVVFLWFEGSAVRCLPVDIILEHRRGGLTVPTVEALIGTRRRNGMFWIPGPEPEFAYLLAKKAWKGKASCRQAARLKTLIEELGRPTAERVARQLFPGTLSVRIVEACVSGSPDDVLAELTGRTWKTALTQTPLRLSRYVVSEAVRWISRWRQPTGLFIVIMGPDGSGKSTLIEQIADSLGRAFRRTRIFHWRPSVVWRRKFTGDATQPHSQPPHGALKSILKLIIYVLDYQAGYWLVVRPLLARSGFVIFDRYYSDITIDPTRYRYGGPSWVVRKLGRLVPSPDLVLLLDAPEHVVLSRKQELTPDELHRQRRSYAWYRNETSCARTINAGGPVHEVTAESARIIIEYLANRFEARRSGNLS